MANIANCWLVQLIPGKRTRIILFLLFVLATHATSSHALLPPIRISAETIEFGSYLASGGTVELSNEGVKVAVANFHSADAGGLSVQDVEVTCATLDVTGPDICAGGSWAAKLLQASAARAIQVTGVIAQGSKDAGEWSLHSSVISGAFSANARLKGDDRQFSAQLAWDRQAIRSLPETSLLSTELHWVRNGTTTGKLAILVPREGSAKMHISGAMNGLGFDSPDGRFAGENLDLGLAADVAPGATTATKFDLAILAGDVLIDNFYTAVSAPGLRLQGSILLDGNEARLEDFQLSDGRSLKLAASAVFDTSEPFGSLEYRVAQLELNFPEAYGRYLESLAANWALDGLTVTGRLLWSGAGKAAAGAGVLDLVDVTIADTRRNRFAVTGLDAHVLPGDAGIDSTFSWKGLLLQQINLGAGKTGIDATPGQFSLASPLHLNVLGGRLELEQLQVLLPGKAPNDLAEPEIRLYATLEDLEMDQLALALGWPAFGGTISGRIPGVKMNSGVLEVAGGIEFKVFDGQVRLSGVRVERPFGVLPSLAADLDVENLDLQQVTNTFSFGQISGRMSGFVHDLRMLDWEPVAFDAWFGTPEREKGSNKISRRAVNQLTTIGGGSSTAALTGPVLKLFSSFSYRRLGLGCRLQNYTCEVRGLDDNDASALIMEGAGVPKIMIRVFNRSMDWPTLLAGLSAAASGEEIQIGNKD